MDVLLSKSDPEERDEVLQFIGRRWKKDANWLDGNCYYFALILCHRFAHLNAYYAPVSGHFVSGDGTGMFYDWTGIWNQTEEPILLDDLKNMDPKWYEMIVDGCVL